MPFYAHSKNRIGKRHNLIDHLSSVAEAARGFASKFGSSDLAYYAGLWHDVGKVDPAFQEYLKLCESQPERSHRGPDHKGLGAKEVINLHQLLAFIIKGHHGGLPSKVDLKNWLSILTPSKAIWDSLKSLERDLPHLLEKPTLTIPSFAQSDPVRAEFYIRMLFSALVDADFLDTETHFSHDISTIRSKPFDFSDLWRRFSEDQGRLTGRTDNLVNQIRHEVYGACLRTSELPQGLFRLTVPTGGGKTRSALAFALRHVIKHNLDRIIVAIPFTSIIEQTAQVYRDVLGPEPILEHHSMVNYEEREDEGDACLSWLRLAAENWDAPVIVTTTVQLFESLFSNSTSKCRKLHNITRSVIILDEVQYLPVPLLRPILDAIRQLVDHYGVTVVLCTATQPEYSTVSCLGRVERMTEIVPDKGRLFSGLKRVNYRWPKVGENWSWRQVANEMKGLDQVLAVVNTKKDAIALLDAIGDPTTLHLSTLLCGAHRRDVLNEVKKRLVRGDLCRLVSTQVIEAGVDIDFPVVFRAVGPLDSLVQSAGRCNREGRLNVGRVVVFTPEEGGMPPGAYRTGADTARSLMQRSDFDIDNPEIFSTYFRLLFQVQETDAEGIQELRSALEYPKVSSVFRMIKDETVPVIVRYHGISEKDVAINHLIDNFRSPEFTPQRSTLRRLQPYMVSIRAYDLEKYKNEGLIRELTEGFFEWMGGYDPVRGLDARAIDPADLII